MIVYHGSNSNFKKLRISSSLVKHESTKTNEGLGIYFSTNKEVARSYGKYIYTLEINDRYFVDFRNKAKCRLYVIALVKNIYNETKIDISKYLDINDLVNRMYWGGQSISGVGREIYMILDSNEKWYFSTPSSKIERIYQILRAYDKKHLYAYMFKYHIKDIGVLKSVNTDVVRILCKENSY